MRERITVTFVVLVLLVVAGAATVRAFTIRDLLREQESDHLRHHTVLAGRLIADQRERGRAADRAYLTGLVGPAHRLQYVDPEGRSIAVRGADYEGDPGDDLSVTLATDVGE